MTGPPGDAGAQGPPGATTCPGATIGLIGAMSVSAPAHGGFFASGEAPEITIRLTNRCGGPIQVASLGTANLYLSGPRQPLLTKTASKLLNCVTDRAAADRQHHFVNLIAPKFADPAQNNLRADPDGTLHYRLASVSDEPPGTYTVGVWAKSKDEQDQIFALQDLQIGTATPEAYASGPANASSCADCHLGPQSGVMYLAHTFPGFSPLGNFALDIAPVGTCKSCHNQDGYSENPIVRKVHAAHRGAHQVTPGVAHPEYGLAADGTLAEFTNVTFPSMPDKEKDCVKCHKDDSWLKAPSRLACGTCHETVFFDTGTVNPPRELGKPAGKSCVMDSDCASLGQLAACNTGSGSCEVRTHPKQADDSQCATCHSGDASGIVPIAASHEVLSRTRVRGLQVTSVSLSGGSGPSGAVLPGDSLTLKFNLTDKAGNAITDLKTNAALSGTVIIGGPTDDRQLVLGSLAVKTAGTLTYDGTSYVYALPAPFPASAQPPQNTSGMGRPNPAGTYTAWVYVTESLTVNGQSVRDFGGALLDFAVTTGKPALPPLPIQPRQVITSAACSSCHVDTQAHGGGRRGGEGCSLCHTAGAVDRGIGAKGAACTTTAQCGGAAAGWEACQDTNGDGKLDTCVITSDPQPNQTIAFMSMIHSIHFGRLLEGYAERHNRVSPGKLIIIGFQNSANDFSDILLPMDVRNCTKCHADSGAVCSATAPCGVGQSCVGGKCQNVAWQQPSSAVCLSCHDADDSNGHAALMTWTDKDGTVVETCGVCHGPSGDYAVSKVHALVSPYKPPYQRSAQ